MSDTESELSNVVIFPVKDESDPREHINFRQEDETNFCIHPAYWINEENRHIRCQKCNAIIDPFDLMLRIARKETRLANDVRLLRKEERQRRANIEKLIQIERNAKARIRRAEKKGSNQ